MERKLAVIFSTDVQGYSRLMGDDEEAIALFAFQILQQINEVVLCSLQPLSTPQTFRIR